MKKHVINVALTAISFLISLPAFSQIHEYPCSHICNSPTCIANNITAWESNNAAGCANVDHDSISSTPTYVTDCSRLDFVGAKRSANTKLHCFAGQCTISGTFKCPSLTGFKITAYFSQTCPSRGGEAPLALITDKTNYGYGVGTYAECYWPDGHVLMIRCNEQDGSGTVFVTEF